MLNKYILNLSSVKLLLIKLLQQLWILSFTETKGNKNDDSYYPLLSINKLSDLLTD